MCLGVAQSRVKDYQSAWSTLHDAKSMAEWLEKDGAPTGERPRTVGIMLVDVCLKLDGVRDDWGYLEKARLEFEEMYGADAKRHTDYLAVIQLLAKSWIAGCTADTSGWLERPPTLEEMVQNAVSFADEALDCTF